MSLFFRTTFSVTIAFVNTSTVAQSPPARPTQRPFRGILAGAIAARDAGGSFSRPRKSARGIAITTRGVYRAPNAGISWTRPILTTPRTETFTADIVTTPNSAPSPPAPETCGRSGRRRATPPVAPDAPAEFSRPKRSSRATVGITAPV